MSGSADTVYSPIHHVFQIDELVRLILEDMDLEDCAPMARVQKQIGSLALDRLWNVTTLERLLFLFPPEILSTARWGRREFKRSPLESEWNRYDFYGPRVRTLYRHNPFACGAWVNLPNVLLVLGDRGRLINLHHLRWTAPSREFPYTCMFIVPSLLSMVLSDKDDHHESLDPPDLCSASDGLMFHQQVDAPLQKLIDLRVSLQRLELPVPEHRAKHPEPTLALYQSKFPSLMTNSLVHVDLFVSDELMHVLGTMPTLKSLKMRYYPGENGSQVNGDISEAFKGLEDLQVYDTPSLRDVTSLIQMAGCFPSSSLSINILRVPSGCKVTQLFNVVLGSSRSRSLRGFELRISEAKKEDREVQVDEDDDIFRNRFATLDHFRPLLPLDMRRVCLELGYPLSVSDEQLEELVSAWPLLTGLYLCAKSPYKRPDAQPRNSVTLHGLQHLASLAHLKRATIEVKINREDILFLPEAVSDSPLKSLDVEGSTIETEDTIPMGYYLAYLFPKLKLLVYEAFLDEEDMPDDPSPWYKVNAVIQEVRAFNEGTLSDSHPKGQYTLHWTTDDSNPEVSDSGASDSEMSIVLSEPDDQDN